MEDAAAIFPHPLSQVLVTALHRIPANYPHELRRTKTAQCGGSEAQPRLGARDGETRHFASAPAPPCAPFVYCRPLPSSSPNKHIICKWGEHGHSTGRGRSKRTQRWRKWVEEVWGGGGSEVEGEEGRGSEATGGSSSSNSSLKSPVMSAD